MGCKSLKKVASVKQIMEQIAGITTSGQLKPGSKPPNERDLAESSGAIGGWIRKALRAPSLVGMLTTEPGGGSFVSEERTKVLEEAVMWMYCQEMNKHDEIYAARSLTETEVYLTCYDNRALEILERLDGFRDRLLDVGTEEVTIEAFCQLSAGTDIYMGDVCDNGIYARLIQIMVLMRKEPAMKILSLVSSKESAVFYHYKILSSFHQGDRNKVKKCLNDFFKYSIRGISIQE